MARPWCPIVRGPPQGRPDSKGRPDKGRPDKGRIVKIVEIETYLVGAGWKNWLFVRVVTDEGL